MTALLLDGLTLCCTYNPDERLVETNVRILKDKDYRAQLDSNKDENNVGYESQTVVAWDKKTGEMKTYADIRNMTAVQTGNMFETKVQGCGLLYHIYPNYSPHRGLLRMLISMEKQLNQNNEAQWLGSFKQKIKKVKQLYGLAEAIRWNREYYDMMGGDYTYVLYDLLWLK